LKNLSVLVNLILEDHIGIFGSFTNTFEVGLQSRPQVGLGHLKAHGVIPVTESDSKRSRYQLVIGLNTNIVSMLDRLNVVGMGGVRPDAVLVHQGNEVGLGQQLGRFCCALKEVNAGRLELFDALVVGNLLVGPLVIWIDFQIVTLDHGEPMGDKLLPVDVDVDGGLLALGVLGETSQKVTYYRERIIETLERRERLRDRRMNCCVSALS
jgi:hypothetical protein